MGKQYKINGLQCPHCGLVNTMIVDLPLYGKKEHISRCWNGDVEKGCNKEFQIVMQVSAITDLTAAQKKILAQEKLSFNLNL